MRTSWIAVLALACGCGGGGSSGQSFHDGVAAVCETPDHVPAPNGDSYEKRVAVVAAWADKHVTNADARKVGMIDGKMPTEPAVAMDQLAQAVKKAGVTSCKLLDNQLALQSFADAMTIVCDTPDDKAGVPEYLKTHLLNPEVVSMVSAIGDAAPPDRVRIVREMATRAGLTRCALADRMEKLPPPATPTPTPTPAPPPPPPTTTPP